MKAGDKDKTRTRDWYRSQGYDCEYAELKRTIFLGQGKFVFQTNDIFASDGIAMNGKEIVFWNSKGRAGKKKGTLGSSLRKFNSFQFPDFVTREIVVWENDEKYKNRTKKNPYRLRICKGKIYSIDSEGKKTKYEYRNGKLLKKK